MIPAPCGPWSEVCCQDGLAPGLGWIWFRCAYQGCHAGVGHVTIEAGGEVLYDGCPTQGSRKLAWLDFPGAKLWEGGLMQVNYGVEGCSRGGHTCSRATFQWGGYQNLDQPLGTAYLDNAGGPNDLGNVCDPGALPIWRVIASQGVPSLGYLEVDLAEIFPPTGDYWRGAPGGDGNFSAATIGPYDRDRWIFSGTASADDDLILDGERIFPNNISDQIGGGNVFLKFLPRGRTATLNIWNAGGVTGASGSLRLYGPSSPSPAGGSSRGGTRCNYFIIPPRTIGAWQQLPAEAGTRRICYQKGATLPAAPACPPSPGVPVCYVPAVAGVTTKITGFSDPIASTATFHQIASPPSQVPADLRPVVGDPELWSASQVAIAGVGGVNVGATGENIWLHVFFPASKYAREAGRLAVGVALAYHQGQFALAEIEVGQAAVLPFTFSGYFGNNLSLEVTVQVIFRPGGDCGSGQGLGLSIL